MNKIIGIYKYQNKLNGNIYIGQSVDINRRYNQHLQEANSNKAITAIDLAISKYGIENFDFSIIEECPKEKLDERERYWIQYYDSYNNGYNNTPGGVSLRGSEHPRALLDENDVWEIREMYKNHISRRDVFKKFKNKISEEDFLKFGIVKIGQTFIQMFIQKKISNGTKRMSVIQKTKLAFLL